MALTMMMSEDDAHPPPPPAPAPANRSNDDEQTDELNIMIGLEEECAESVGGESDNHSDLDDSSNSEEEEGEEDEEYGDAALEQELKDRILSRDDRNRMLLTEEEWHWALAIKEAIQNDADNDEIDNLSDFWYAHLAIICKDNVEDAIERVQTLQAFREEYDIKDTYEDGCYALKQMFDLSPGQFLDFSFSQREGTYTYVHDSTKVDSTRLRTTNAKWKAFMAVTYYTYNTWNPDLDTIRKGVIVIAECEGWSWTKKQDFKVFQLMFQQLISAYPFNGNLRCYNTGVIWNMMCSMLNKMLPPNVRDTIHTGFQTDGGRLDEYFLVPDETTANQRMFTNMADTLKRRYDNERTFNLLDCPIYRPSRNTTGT